MSSLIVPIMGLITSNFLAFSAYPELAKSDATRAVGELNVFPIAMMVPNNAAWLFYAVATANIWVWWSNFPGFIISLWYISVLLRCLDLRQNQLLTMQIVVGVGLTVNFMGLMCFIELENTAGFEALSSITGMAAITCLCIFYAAPISTLIKVIRTKDSTSLVLPLSIATTMNSLIWATFGIVNNDAFVYGPSLIGVVNGTAQIISIWLYPPKVYVKTLDDPSSEKLMYRNTSFGSVATELNFATDSRFFNLGAEDNVTPPESPSHIDMYHPRMRQRSSSSEFV